MIVQCSKCQGKMRVDQDRIPPGEKVKIRCPLCGEIQAYSGQPHGFVPADKPEIRQQSVSPSPKVAVRGQNASSALSRGPQEPSIPSDAFQDFRFPAERGGNPTSRNRTSEKPRRKGLHAAIFILASLAVIAVFALIVNIVLPGPAGKRPMQGLPQWEEQHDREAPPARPMR
jgi:predicted Zn finger-like uncharacterized protein